MIQFNAKPVSDLPTFPADLGFMAPSHLRIRPAPLLPNSIFYIDIKPGSDGTVLCKVHLLLGLSVWRCPGFEDIRSAGVCLAKR
mmetsp:Transcript_31701/g.57764  ORF Transcript_31701/g.57764 Transcript_31701/m.57764 type:complete len:84 (-) Transcript_31701:1431-1682(-)